MIIKKIKIPNDYKIFSTPNDVKKWANSNYSKSYIEKFNNYYYTNNDPYFLGLYKGSLYIIYNDILRNENINYTYNYFLKRLPNMSCTIQERLFFSCFPDKNRFNTFSKEIETLQSFIESNIIKEDIVAYRFSCKKEYHYFKKNKYCEIKQFLSTTLLPTQYNGLPYIYENKVLIKILIPKGTRGLFLPEINPERSEYEILLPHHSKLKYLGKSEDVNERLPSFIIINKETNESQE